jgi:hypothetical protein
MRGMIFNEKMGQAIYDGLKTQTRRIIDPQPPEWSEGRVIKNIYGNLWGLMAVNVAVAACRSEDTIKCPWEIGEQLFVREPWHHYKTEELEMAAYPGGTIVNPTDGTAPRFHENSDFDPRHYAIWKRMQAEEMPPWAARGLIEVSEVRAERVQEISENDAFREGALVWWNLLTHAEQIHIYEGGNGPIEAFKYLWKSIHGEGSWDRNDWVWVIGFKVLEVKGRAAVA